MNKERQHMENINTVDWARRDLIGRESCQIILQRKKRCNNVIWVCLNEAFLNENGSNEYSYSTNILFQT